METRKHTYHIRAFAPDPRSKDNYFTYNGTVDRSVPIDSVKQYDVLLQGLSDHVYSETGVRCSPNSFSLQSVKQIGQ